MKKSSLILFGMLISLFTISPLVHNQTTNAQLGDIIPPPPTPLLDAKDDSATTNEDNSVTIDVLSNDSYSGIGQLTVKSVTKPSKGAAIINPDNTIKYTPNPNFFGSDSFQYTASDSTGLVTDTATVSITVTSVNDIPVATNDSVTTPEDTPATINVIANDSDVDGDTLTVTSTSAPSSGTATINADKTITYTPTPNFFGSDSFTYTISDGKGGTATATVSITVTSVNDIPVATNDSVQQQESFAAQPIVDSLDFARFKQTIQNITSIGSRLQGTQSNTDALAWIEKQLVSMGYDVNRHSFTFNGEPRQSVYATKIGTTKPNQMYIIAAHMDGVGGNEAADDNGSGVALVLEAARVLANPNVKTDTSIRFILFNNEETFLAGSTAYVQDRKDLQGIEFPPGSGLYPEPAWLGMISYDMILYDHGVPPQPDQIPAADIDIEFRGDAIKSVEAGSFAKLIQLANSKYSVKYPAEIGSLMCCTDSWPFRNHTAAVSVAENQLLTVTLQGANPHWHKPSDLFSTYSEADFQLGFDTVRMTTGLLAELAGATIPVTINVLANDSDQDGDALSVTSTSAPSNGTATINANNTITYTPNQSFVGTDSFTYTISDGNGGFASATVTVTVIAVNDPPIANNDGATTNEDTSVTIDVLANDFDPDGDTISLDSFNATSKFNGIITRDNNGTQLDQSDDKLIYTPPVNAFGIDKFSYTISDGNDGLDSATVIVIVTSVNDPPVANNDSAQTQANTPVTINVLANDSDPDGNTLSVTSTSAPSSGTATINANNTITYTPNQSFVGTDSFTYTISDGNGGFASATVTVTVTAVNNPPIATNSSNPNSDTILLNSSGEFSTGILVPLYVFPFNDTSWQPLIDAKINHPNVPMIAVINPSNGSGTVQNQQLSEQIPRLQAVGIKTIGYVATDRANKTINDVKLEIDSWKQLYPNIKGIFFDEMSNLPGNEPYYSQLDAYAKSKDGFDFTVGNVGVDTIPSYVGTVDNIVIHENNSLPSLEDLSGWHASYDKGNFSILVHTHPQLNASQIVSASNHVSYLYVTDDELAPQAGDHDPWGTISSHIEVLAESLDRPSVTIRIDSRNLAGDSIKPNNLASDNASNLVISSGGVVVRTGSSPLFYNATNAITYTVSAVDFGNFTFAHWENFDENNTRTITPLQDTALVAFYDNVPTAVDDSAQTQVNTPVTINVLANDSDQDGNALSVTSTSAPSNGTATINANNTITYSPNQSFVGTDSFTYTISDGKGGSDTATVTVTVTAVNNPPIAADDSAQTQVNTPVTINVLANDSDPDGNTLSVVSASTPSNGTALINSNNTITYSPNSGFSGTNSFIYTISDGNGGSDTAAVTVTVSATAPPSTTLTVRSADLSGTIFEGIWVELFQGGQIINSGFTPFSITVDSGVPYVVDVANSFENIIFDHWEDGTTNPARAFTILQDASFTAFYQTGTAS